MENKLTFASVYKSISQLPDVTLPKLVVLTGRNGSGKTHLLEAIKTGKVRSTLVSNLQNDVLLFDWNNIIPQDTGIFHPAHYQTQQSNWFNQIRAQQDQQFPNIQQQIINLGVPAKHCSSLKKIRNLDEKKLSEIFPGSDKVKSVSDQLHQQLNSLGKNIYQQTINNIGDEHWKKAASHVVNENPELFLEHSESKFFNEDKFLWGHVDAFQQAFGRVFSTYRDLIHKNDRLEKYPPEDDTSLRHLDNDAFIERYNEPPWDFVNQILETCQLDFRIEAPPLHEASSYEPKLLKLTSDIEMRFQDLSSGEKVLMSFALCLYNAQDTRQEKIFPKLLLLDEVDAPLHPSMVLSLLNTIQDVLIDSKGVSVILTTHSPSTVALAPEGALYEMNSEGPSIEKISHSKALSILTIGVPTLSVSFDGRRQVFVESRTDAYIYEKLYQLFKSKIDSERSLIFIEVGRTDESGGERNSGCEQVKRLVESLSDAGNTSVFGLIDWDGNREPTDRIHVLSHEMRNGIESLLFDPVLIATTAIKENIEYCKEKGLVSKQDRYIDIASWDQGKWQQVVNKLQSLIIDEKPKDHDVIEVQYLSNMKLNISKKYLYLDDHDLENKIIEAFGFLKPKNNRAGGLMSHVVLSVISDYPNLIPQDLLDTFNNILGEEI